MEGKGGLDAVNEVKELFRVWETEVYAKTRGDHRWQLDVKFKQKEVLDGLKVLLSFSLLFAYVS